MPPLLPVQATARVVVNGRFTVANTNSATIFHVRRTPTGSDLSQAEVDAIAAGVRAAWVTNFISLQAPQWTLGTVTATDLSTSFGLVGVATGSNPGTGGGTNNPPTMACVGISWSQAQHFRGGHPRSYMPGLRTTDFGTGSNVITAAAVTAWRTAAQAFLTAVNAITVGGAANLVLVRRVSGGVNLTPPTVNNITNAGVDARIDTQRRRLGPDLLP